MSKPIVFVDTNAVNNRSCTTKFFGGRSEIEKIAKRGHIAIPRVVYDELCKHVREYIAKQGDEFSKNSYRHLLSITDEDIDKIDPDQLVMRLADEESVAYEIVDLQSSNKAYDEIYVHSLNGTPPFENSGDKGFKDSLIAKTIDQYIDKYPEKNIFLLTKDKKLKEYFTNSKVSIIEGHSDFDREYSDDKLDEYLISRVIDYLSDEGLKIIGSLKLSDQYYNLNEDIVAKFIDDQGGIYQVVIDSNAREPIAQKCTNLETIDQLRDVNSFARAHDAVICINDEYSYFSIDTLKRIVSEMMTNDQIYGIALDDDIAELAKRIIEDLDKNGEEELAHDLKTKYRLNVLTAKDIANLPF